MFIQERSGHYNSTILQIGLEVMSQSIHPQLLGFRVVHDPPVLHWVLKLHTEHGAIPSVAIHTEGRAMRTVPNAAVDRWGCVGAQS